MSKCPDGFQPVIDRRGRRRLPESWHDQLVMFVLPGETTPRALRFDDISQRTNLQKVFFRASDAALEDAWGQLREAETANTVSAEPVEPPPMPATPAARVEAKPLMAPTHTSSPIFFRRQWRVDADALPPSRLFTRMRTQRDAIVEKLGRKLVPAERASA